MKPSTLLIAVLWCAAAASHAETKEDLVNKLQGQAKAQSNASAAGGKTRGFVPRGATKPATIATERRAVRFSGRGIPKNIQVAENAKVHVTKVEDSTYAAAGEQTYEISYNVDPESNVTRTSILFVKDSTEFADGNSKIELARLAQAFKDPALAEYSFVIEGHSSAEGSTPHNQQLSQDRAAAIVAELIGYGVAEGKLVPVGFGESKARYEAHAPESLRSQDRRVEIYRLE